MVGVVQESHQRQPPRFISERKRGIPSNYFPPPLEPELEEGDEIVATISGMEITVKEPRHATMVYSMGSFGTFLGQRMNFPNLRCFEPSTHSLDDSKVPSNLVEERAGTSQKGSLINQELVKKEATGWMGKNVGGGWLHLSPVEAFYLFNDLRKIKLVGFAIPSASGDLFNLFKSTFGLAFVRRYQVYRYFRRLGWVVRDGISFGMDFLLYKDSVDLHHACAGLRVLESMTDPVVSEAALHAALRELTNCKKGLLLAAVEFLNPVDKLRLEDLELAKVHVLSMSPWSTNKQRATDLD